MMKAFAQFFSMLTILFQAGETGAKAVGHLADWAENGTRILKEEAVIEGQRKLAIARANAAKPLPADEVQAIAA